VARRSGIISSAKAIPSAQAPSSANQGLPGTYSGRPSPLAAQLDTGASANWASAYQRYLPRPAQDFTDGAFGPFSPILPVPVDGPEQGTDLPDPRLWQYQVGWNLPTGTPGSEGYKLADFATLKTLAELYSVARACIQLRKNEICGLNWDISPTSEASKAMRGDTGAMRDFGERRAKAVKFFNRPDPDYFSWGSFLSALLEDVFVYDALSLLIRSKWGKGRGRGVLGSDLDCLNLISGPTIRPLLDMNGARPRPPAPAYQQYLYGVPRSDIMTVVTERDLDEAGLRGKGGNTWNADQLIYLPMVPRRDSPYGFAPIERALIPVMAGLQKQGFQLDFYREGTVPAVYVSPGGVNANMSPNQIRELQDALNAIAGDPAWKHKIIVLPADSKVEPQRPPQLADQFDEIVMSQVCMAFDVQPMELGIMPKVSTTVSPGASNQMAKATASIHERKATKPTLTFLVDIFNRILQDVCGQTDMQFMFEGLEEDEDEETQTNLIVSQIGAGLRSIDEGREVLGLQPWGLPETSDPGWATATGFVPLGQLTPSGDVAPGPQPDAQNPAGAAADGQQAAAGTATQGGAKPGTGKPADAGTPGHAAAQAAADASNPSASKGAGAGAHPHQVRRDAHVRAGQDTVESRLRQIADAYRDGRLTAPDAVDTAVAAMAGGYRHAMRGAAAHAKDDHGPSRVAKVADLDLLGGEDTGDDTGDEEGDDWADDGIDADAQARAETQRPYLGRLIKDLAAGAAASLGARLALYGQTLIGAYNAAYGTVMGRNRPGYEIVWRLGNAEHCYECRGRDGQVFTQDTLPGWPGDGGFGGALCLGGPRCACWLQYRQAGQVLAEGGNTQRDESGPYYQQQLADITARRQRAARERQDFVDSLPGGAQARAQNRDDIRRELAQLENQRIRQDGGYHGVSVEPPDIPASDVAAHPAHMKGADAELDALARHVRKGRLLSTWEPRHVSQQLLARVAEYHAKGLGIAEAIAVAKQLRRVDTNGQEYWADDEDTWAVPAGGGGPELVPHDAHGIENAAKGARISGPSVASGVVVEEMLRNYPQRALEWMRGARWVGPVRVPLDLIDLDDVHSWAASHQPDRVRHFADKLRDGKAVRPVIAVQEPGDPKVKVIDGHHRTLAYQMLGQPVIAYVGLVDQDGGPWDETHAFQHHQDTDPASKTAGKVSKAEVNYRPSSDPRRRCGTCVMFQAPHSCTLVAGTIQAGDVCDRWAPKNTSKAAPPVAAGVAVRAADTGRVLMLQRAVTNGDPAAGAWEFPGGCLEPGETAAMGAAREWQEETGCALPPGHLTGRWASPSGVYEGLVYEVPSESDVPISDGRDAVINPDDPDGDVFEALAWWSPEQLADNPAVRAELLADLDLVLDALGTDETVKAAALFKAAELHGNPQALRRWFEQGAGGRIPWGEPGDFDACVRVASEHMSEEQARGFCNLRHRSATGMSTSAHAEQDKR
jgi:8-oxo-dGTP pyrophosphatase MutT (NUDIX family)